MTYTSARNRRLRRDRLRNLAAEAIALALKGVVLVLIAYFITWVGINWVTGCGETFITYTGERIAGECVPFLVWEW